MRVIGRSVHGLPAALPSVRALREAAIHPTTTAALAPLATTGVRQGIYRFASQRTMLANGAVLVAHFTKPAAFGGKAGLRYRIALTCS